MKYLRLSSILILGLAVMGSFVWAQEEKKREVPTLSNALGVHVNEGELKPIPDSEKRFPNEIRPDFSDLSSEPGPGVKYPKRSQ